MMMDKSVDILNSLIMVNNDRIAGYKVAICEAKDEDLKYHIMQFIETSKECKSELSAEVEKLGGRPEDMIRVNGKIFRAWMDFKIFVLNKNRRALLSSCDYGEFVALNFYEKVLASKDLDSSFIPMIKSQLQHIKIQRDSILEIRMPLMTA